ncbi:MAG: COX15/CtaA family protein [Flavobacteriaceae bacterium]
MSEAVIDRGIAADRNRSVRIWLQIVALAIAAMVLVGGATRLTDSGLSITEWKPIVGIVPPLTDADWNDAFEKYRQIPEYSRINKGMSLSEFKGIFWWEWAHRFLGRMIGFLFLVPFVWFWRTGRIGRELAPRLAAIFVLGGLQGALGWYMVASGLVDRVDVSQYRLAAHLTLAILIFAAVIWVARSLGRPPSRPRPAALRSTAWLLAALLLAQIVFGGFVAGLDAGLGYPTWPLMDGQLIPDGLLFMSPWWTNFFESVLTVQFVHRCLGYAVVLLAIVHAARSWGLGGSRRALMLAAMAFLQMLLGIATLLSGVDLPVALTHQAGALVLVALLVSHLQSLYVAPAK